MSCHVVNHPASTWRTCQFSYTCKRLQSQSFGPPFFFFYIFSPKPSKNSLTKLNCEEIKQKRRRKKKMSGATLAVAPDEPNPSLLRKEQKHLKNQQAVGIMGSLRVIELQLVAFIMVFSASGLVPLLDLSFPALSSAYLLIISRLAFPTHSRCGPPELFQGGRLFRAYVVFGTTVGLFLPLAYVLGGFARGDEHAVRSATPHLFLLSFQILTENIISRWSLFSPPVRAFVPLLYTVRRVFVILDWMQDVWVNKSLPATADFKVTLTYIYTNLMNPITYIHYLVITCSTSPLACA